MSSEINLAHYIRTLRISTCIACIIVVSFYQGLVEKNNCLQQMNMSPWIRIFPLIIAAPAFLLQPSSPAAWRRPAPPRPRLLGVQPPPARPLRPPTRPRQHLSRRLPRRRSPRHLDRLVRLPVGGGAAVRRRRNVGALRDGRAAWRTAAVELAAEVRRSESAAERRQWRGDDAGRVLHERRRLPLRRRRRATNVTVTATEKDHSCTPLKIREATMRRTTLGCDERR